ncbi:MAG TPA: ABC transporter ATP-binding protein [Chloroflexota bacterium]|nr:ABC transporter ATP-binding protein [Chloroflexota bacterium]
MKTLLRIWPFFKSYRLLMFFALLAVIAQSLFTLVVPSLTGLAVDQGVVTHNVNELIFLSGLILLFSFLRGMATFLQFYLGENAAQGVSYQLRKTVYAHIQSLSFGFHDQAQTGELLAHGTSDVEQLRNFTGRGLLMIFNLTLLMLGVTVALLKMDWRLAALSVLILPAIYWRAARFSLTIRPMFRIVQDQIARLATVIQDNAAGMRVVKAFGHEQEEIAHFDKENAALYDGYLDSTRQTAFNTPLLQLMSNVSTLTMLWVAGYLVIVRAITPGELVAFYAYLLQLVGPVARGGFLMAMAARAAASSERILEILDAPIAVANRDDAEQLPPIDGRVEFQDVSCAYHPGRPVLEHVSFVVEPDHMVALVGATGSGKTTVANLLPRFYDVSEGRVLIDGRDVRDVSLTSLRKQVGVVMQETTLFTGTIRDNITFGRPGVDDDTIRRAAKAARADEFIDRLPDGYDTIVGERGASLSGGQKQRVAIARALIMDPRLLILDEFTSAVDVETERLIRAALLELMRGRTTFVIAHRLSTVRAADSILVLARGRLVASGTHEQLLETSPVYRDIHASQLSSTGDDAEPGGVGPEAELASEVAG